MRWTLNSDGSGKNTFKTRKDARNAKRLEVVRQKVDTGDINGAIAVVLKMIGREITKSHS